MLQTLMPAAPAEPHHVLRVLRIWRSAKACSPIHCKPREKVMLSEEFWREKCLMKNLD